MGTHYYHVKRKKSGARKVLSGLLMLTVGSLLLAAVVAPASTGRFGGAIHLALKRFAGWAAFLIPLFLVWMGAQQFLRERASRLRDSALFASVTLFLSGLFSLHHAAGSRQPGGWGGWLGDRVALFMVHQFGVALTFLISACALFVSVSLLLRVHPAAFLHSLREKIRQDLEDWREERKKLKERDELKKKLDRVLPVPGPKPPAPERPPAVSGDGGEVSPSLTSILERKLKAMSRPEPVPKPQTAESKPAAPPLSQPPAPGTETAPASYAGYALPDPDLLTLPEQTAPTISKEELYANGTHLEKTLEQFGVKAKVVDIHPGPVITRYDLAPAPGIRVQAIESLADDVALAMKAQSLRVLAPVPGKAAVGIEISNSHSAMVFLKEIVLSPQFQNSAKGLPIGLGKTTEGAGFVTDLAAMPHLLIAGATGSGKSVCIHAFILSILFRMKPDEVKLLLIDPKRLELPLYDGIPHLYDPSVPADEVRVITQPKDVVAALKKLIEVMEERYKLFARSGVRNIEGYNEKAAAQKGAKVAYIVVVIDELADLMIVVGREIEDMIQRLAQMARAVGIHLVLATQRPSVDVITGVIKANLPSRVAFQVLSKTDSRVILDSQGAEDLLGRGDMLFLATGAPKPVRLQGAYVSEAEVERVTRFIKEQGFKPAYELYGTKASEESIVDNEDNRDLLVRAARVVRDTEKVSGDLLRADREIGSKYDLALTLLKKKGLIEKPKDTNRWKIHFDRLEGFLADVESRTE